MPDGLPPALAAAALRRARQIETHERELALQRARIHRDYDVSRDSNRAQRRDRALRSLERRAARVRLKIRCHYETAVREEGRAFAG